MSSQTALDETVNVSRLSLLNPNMVKKIHREVRFGNYILGSTLGEGEFGKVKLGWRKDGKLPNQVAIKLIKRDSITKDSENEVKIHREINSLKLLNHPNIVNLVEVMKSGKYIGIVLEYASGGELFDYILNHKYLKENVAKKIFAQLVSGVDYMHSKGLIHRDLKLENLLLDKHRNVIISDFGFVNSYNRNKNDYMKTSCGSPCYAAPELVLTQSPYEGRKVDIWSLGVILYAMLSGYLPFDDDPENEDGSDIVRLYHYICKTPLTFPEYVSPLARDLLRKIIVPDPKKRIDINEIRNHPWLSPYANLLSIRQPEWDNIHKEKTVKEASGQPQASATQSQRNKRFSMIAETTNSAQLMNSSTPMRKQHGRSYSGSGQFYPSASAVPNSISTTSVNTPAQVSPTRLQGAANDNMQLLNNSSPYRGHTKSASISNSYPSSTIQTSIAENAIDSPEETPKPDEHPKNLPSPIKTRANTYQPISTIIESPTRAESFVTTLKEAPLSSKKDNPRLPHATKRPRPTSYHPTNSFNNSASSLLEFYKVPSPISIPLTQFLSSSPPKNNSPGSESSASAEPNSEQLANDLVNLNGNMVKSTNSIPSRRNSVVTHVHVNGVLSRETMSNSEKRNSVLSYLEDKMNTLELTEAHSPQKTEFPRESVTAPGEIPEIPPSPLKGSKQADKSSSVSRASSVSRSNSVSRRQQRKTEKKAKKEGSTLRENNKENKEMKEQKKRNRFSLLSFYNTYSSSSNNVAIAEAPSSKPNRKVLEPSELNIPAPQAPFKEAKRVGSSSSSKSNNSKKSTNSSASTNDSAKEASAAKKVMDFFKRRSIRIG